MGSSAESHLPFDNPLNASRQARARQRCHKQADTQLCHQSKFEPLECHKCDISFKKGDVKICSFVRFVKTLPLIPSIGMGVVVDSIMGVFVDLFGQNRLTSSLYQQPNISEMAS